jgi:hypothetical protein
VHFGIPWVEDETNHDRTLTSRNAIRYILAQHKLPEALSIDKLLQLVQQKGMRDDSAQDTARQLFDISPIQLDVRTGSAVVTMPKLDDINAILPKLAAVSQKLSSKSLTRVLGIYLGLIAQLVRSSSGTATTVYPDELLTIFGGQAERKRFSHADCLFEPLPDGNWLISCAPLRRSANNAVRHMSLRYAHPPRPHAWRDFHYRWWVNVRNPAPGKQLTLRYLQPPHLTRLNERLRAGEIILKDINDPFRTPRNLDAIFRSLGPHYLRFWLPVIVEQSSANERAMAAVDKMDSTLQRAFFTDPNAETVLAFPTLNLRVHGKRQGSVPWWVEDLTWEIWYKHLHRMDGRLEDSIVLSTSKGSRGLV